MNNTSHSLIVESIISNVFDILIKESEGSLDEKFKDFENVRSLTRLLKDGKMYLFSKKYNKILSDGYDKIYNRIQHRPDISDWNDERYDSSWFIIVRDNGKYNLLNSYSGKILSDVWFDKICDATTRNDNFMQYGQIKVINENKQNYVSLDDGHVINEIWVDYLYGLSCQLNERFNHFSEDGRLLFPYWFESEDIYNAEKPIYSVKCNDKPEIKYINPNTGDMYDEDFDEIIFDNGEDGKFLHNVN